MTGSDLVNEIPNAHRPHSTPPEQIHNVRLPKRERVKSENVPKMILENSATTEPTLLIRPMKAAR